MMLSGLSPGGSTVGQIEMASPFARPEPQLGFGFPVHQPRIEKAD
jgi:hypothetical protein